jgi:predicted RNase H-like HicB family nuclease
MQSNQSVPWRIGGQPSKVIETEVTAVIEREEDWFVATCPELGVASQGRTIGDAEKMIKEAVELLLEEADEKEIRRRLCLASARIARC